MVVQLLAKMIIFLSCPKQIKCILIFHNIQIKSFWVLKFLRPNTEIILYRNIYIHYFGKMKSNSHLGSSRI